MEPTGRVYEQASQRCSRPESTAGIAGKETSPREGCTPWQGLPASLPSSATLPCPLPPPYAHSSSLLQPLLASLTWIRAVLQVRNEVAVISVFGILLDLQEKHRAYIP